MTFIEFLKQTANDIIDIICPEVCLGCGRRISRDGEHQICGTCLAGIPKVDHFEQNTNRITDYFISHDVPIEYGSCFFKFNKKGETQKLIHNTKYSGHPELGIRLGRIAATEMKKHGRFSDIDFLIPVPMHPKKQKIRGYNQAEKIAEGLCQIFEKEIRNGILIKTQNTGSQTRMSKDQRMENSKKIFETVGHDENDTNHYLIVDDVYTTGSTLLICAQKLKESRPNCKISIFALAKA